MSRTLQLALAIALLSVGSAQAEPILLKLATAAPDGTLWARELRAFAREVESETRGQVLIKWYWGGIAGDELELDQRIKRGQIDGTASGGALCQEVSPTMRVVGVRGVFNTRDEVSYVLNRLRPTFEEEFKRGGYLYVSAAGLGPDLPFSRRPIQSLDDLRKLKLFHWNIDQRTYLLDRDLGFNLVALRLEEVSAAMEDGRINGFINSPAVTLAFQWLPQVKYVVAMPMGWTWGCLMIASRAFERVTLEQQQIIRSAGAKAGVRLDEVGRQQDDAMLGGVFQKLGIKVLTAPESMRAEFLAAARAARERLGERLVPASALQQVLAMLADYRSEHPSGH
jgi:TRAP-type C4-dicarboxylate transport system substrate-binding protein